MMKHTEYGLKFILQFENGAFRKGVDSQNGVEEGEICVVLDSLFLFCFHHISAT